MNKCEECGQYKSSDYHRCPPAWKCGVIEWDGDNTDEWRKVYAHDAEAAACAYAEQADSEGDYTIISGNPKTVVVVGEGGERVAFSVEGEAVPSYHARMVKEAGA